MTARRRTPVSQDHLDIGFSNQRIGERKSTRASPYNQIIRADSHVLSPDPCSPSVAGSPSLREPALATRRTQLAQFHEPA
jgi:hypothetical protein